MARKRGQGEGSIYQRADGQWVAAISAGHDPKTGKAIRRVVYAKTRREANEKLQALQGAIAGGLPIARRDVTIEALMSEYLEHKRAGWSPRSYGIAESINRLHITGKIGSVTLADLDMRRVAVWLRGMGQTRTAQLARGHLRAACELAIRYDWIPRNPVSLTDAPKVTAKKPKELSREDIRAILTGARNPPPKDPQVAKSTDTDYYPVVAVLLGCGLRIGECLALRWEDWDATSRVLHVRHTLGRKGNASSAGEFDLRKPKTAAGVRDLFAPGFVTDALESIPPKGGEWGLIFCTAAGTPLDTGNVRRGVMAMLKRSGIEGIGLHHMRHAHASLLLDDGVPVPVVASVLGHADPSITARVYAHKLKGTHARVASVMDEVFGSKTTP